MEDLTSFCKGVDYKKQFEALKFVSRVHWNVEKIFLDSYTMATVAKLSIGFEICWMGNVWNFENVQMCISYLKTKIPCIVVFPTREIKKMFFLPYGLVGVHDNPKISALESIPNDAPAAYKNLRPFFNFAIDACKFFKLLPRGFLCSWMHSNPSYVIAEFLYS